MNKQEEQAQYERRVDDYRRARYELAMYMIKVREHTVGYTARFLNMPESSLRYAMQIQGGYFDSRHRNNNNKEATNG